MTRQSWPLQPGDVIDIDFDFAAWLGSDTLSTTAITYGDGIEQAAPPTESATAVKVWVQAAAPYTAGTSKLTVVATTAAARDKEWECWLTLEDR